MEIMVIYKKTKSKYNKLYSAFTFISQICQITVITFYIYCLKVKIYLSRHYLIQIDNSDSNSTDHLEKKNALGTNTQQCQQIQVRETAEIADVESSRSEPIITKYLLCIRYQIRQTMSKVS